MNLRELAESLGLSQTTVSRALNGYPEVREETRARVLAAARAANYTPNSRARRLATGRAMTIGHVIPLAGKTEMVNPIFADFLAGAGEVYAREGYDMLLSVVGPDGAEDAYRQMATNGSVDGVMVQGPQIDDPRVPLLQELGLPFLVHGRTGRPPITAGSTSRTRPPSARPPTSCSISVIGASRSINGQENFDFAARRRAGYEEALIARGVAIDPALMSSDVMTEAYGYAAAAPCSTRRTRRPPSSSPRSSPPSACAGPAGNGPSPWPGPRADLP
jgi:LacI family transcriptional regulator